MASEIAGSIVISIAVDGWACVFDNGSAEICIPRDVVTRSRHSIGSATTVVGSAVLSTQALASNHVSGRVLILLVHGTQSAQIYLARGINAVRGSRIVKLYRNGKIEGIHQTDVVVVAAGSSAGQSELS